MLLFLICWIESTEEYHELRLNRANIDGKCLARRAGQFLTIMVKYNDDYKTKDKTIIWGKKTILS